MNRIGTSRPAAGRARLAALVVAVAVVGSACIHSSPSSRLTGSPHRTRNHSSGGSGPPSPGGPFVLGAVTVTGDVAGQCLPGDQCKGFTVTCPGVQVPADGFLDIHPPSGSPRGLAMFLSGGGGGQLWSQEASADLKVQGQGAGGPIDQKAFAQAKALKATLESKGFETVELVWKTHWIDAAPGEEVGPAHLACRAATIITWVHDNLFVPLGAQAPAAGACGFCVTGNSGGGAAIAYSLAFYGLDSIIDAAVISGGPPYADLAKACLGQAPYAYKAGIERVFDISYGFRQGGPCFSHDAAWEQTWIRDGAATGGSNYDYPHTRILILLGADDTTGVAPHMQAYLARLQAAHTPSLKQATVAGMTHAITASSKGLAEIQNEFLGST